MSQINSLPRMQGATTWGPQDRQGQSTCMKKSASSGWECGVEREALSRATHPPPPSFVGTAGLQQHLCDAGPALSSSHTGSCGPSLQRRPQVELLSPYFTAG